MEEEYGPGIMMQRQRQRMKRLTYPQQVLRLVLPYQS